MNKMIWVGVAVGTLACHSVYAQPKAAEGSTVIMSEPGKATAVSSVEATATVVAVNATTRAVTLKDARGKTFDVVCGDEVKNFSQIHVGNDVKVTYNEALTLELQKVRKASAPMSSSSSVSSAAPGSQPAATVGYQATVLADVVAVDPAKSIISLKGPNGNVMDLKVRNPDHFKVVKKGDQVEATYSQAIAIAVTPAADQKSSKK
jgi:hypothetical protein